ncbi:CRISPR-associated protein Cas5 [Hazenella sp. IB182357]|uniref:CRISPR-associated protein Cas5 n=1 Tax=Polycladospora coralii TaxID=2771432 RepID=A0A926NBG3_9BACL|nr:CRISPR-associated protein Cas5 [Polycladospora coralii]MBD1373493.1 CRISPR-associated protein Cas5 [Polycladospora coralii]
MRIQKFHLRGKMAHFRRYYSNSSALSYSVPPRTTLIGLIAGLLGYARDSYYDVFTPNQCQIAVGIHHAQKKQMQTLSLLMIKKTSDLNGSQPYHSQTPTEMIIPTQIRTGFLDYEVWFHHEDDQLMDKLSQQLHFSYGYASKGVSAALGTAQHIGWIENAEVIEGQKVRETMGEIYSIIPVSNLMELPLAESEHPLQLQKEDFPVHFHSDRTIAQKGNFIVNTAATPVKAKVKQAVRLTDQRLITWMESESDGPT